MNQALGLDEGRRRAILHYSADGIAEIVLGSAMLLSGTIGFALATRWAFFGFLVMAPFCGIGFAVKGIKTRITFPRTGYVALPDPPKRRRIVLPMVVIGSVVTFLAAEPALMPFLKDPADAFPLGFAVLFTGILIVGALHYRMWDLFLPGAAALATAVWIWTFGPGSQGTLWVLAVVGTALTLSGVFRLFLFLQRYPKPA